MTLTNETRHIEWHETCKCIYRLDKIICNSKQPWNKNKYKCEYKELINKGTYDKGYFLNPSNCDCECDKSCGIDEYLDYINCKCEKRLLDPLIGECTENIDVIKSEHEKECGSCIVYIVLFSIFFTISIVIGIYFVYSHWYLKKYLQSVNFNTYKETSIY